MGAKKGMKLEEVLALGSGGELLQSALLRRVVAGFVSAIFRWSAGVALHFARESGGAVYQANHRTSGGSACRDADTAIYQADRVIVHREQAHFYTGSLRRPGSPESLRPHYGLQRLQLPPGQSRAPCRHRRRFSGCWSGVCTAPVPGR